MTTFYPSPIGMIRLEISGRGLAGLEFSDLSETPSRCIETPSHSTETPSHSNQMESRIIRQLDEYFSRKRKVFDLELDLQGTDFQKQVWMELLKIPYGRTITYKELSIRLGNPGVIRAAGAANGANPVSIIVPCHRVIGSDGSLTGYAGGLWRKKWLLDFESDEKFLF
ncbi:MAG TPA: methylated-DNA--[protein]-cysteine S-methyltransferase [Bacteroidales bacterium]|nr:methylated-DNA--[protein]-cysteine S-methyltransferase [Bacteroidales bacterium]